MSSYAVFDYATGKNLGEGKTQEDAVLAACETLATAGAEPKWVKANLVEFNANMNISCAVDLHPLWNGSHLTGMA